uniref:C-type lectin domain-containing protein n=1 Tax=Xiphophorus couchianus TaxID=32473 RepID=A0A3B5L2F0_9TELE
MSIDKLYEYRLQGFKPWTLLLKGNSSTPCTGDWILFKKKCYLFYDKPAPWKTWEESRTLCKTKGADLVVINDLEEQKFVSKHLKYYHSEHHGYWMGLQKVNNTWTWVDGQNKTKHPAGFWE